MAHDCEKHGHIIVRDRRRPLDAVICPACKAVIEEAKQKPQELASPYQVGVTVMLRDEVDDDLALLYESQGIKLGQGKLVQEAKYGGDYWLVEFDGPDGKPIHLTLSPVSFMVVDNDETKGALVEAMLRNA